MKDRKRGILCMLGAAVFFSCMDSLVHLAGDLPAMQKLFFRNLIALFITSVLLYRKRLPPKVPRAHWKPLFLRCLFGTLCIGLEFYAIDHMLLADAVTLNKMAPFFAVVFSAFLLKEKVFPPQILLLCTALGGCMCILRPSLEGFASPVALIGLASGVCAGFAYTEVRVLGTRQVPQQVIIFYFSAFSCLASLPTVLFRYTPMTPRQLSILFLIGLLGMAGQFSITAAYCYAPAKEVSVYDYSQIFFTALLGFLLFRQLPDGLSVLGYIIIASSAILMTLYNLRRDKSLSPST